MPKPWGFQGCLSGQGIISLRPRRAELTAEGASAAVAGKLQET